MERVMEHIEPFVGSIDKQREARRRMVRAQVAALRASGMTETADHYEQLAMREVEIVSHCTRCNLELIGNDDCPRCGIPSYEEVAI